MNPSSLFYDHLIESLEVKQYLLDRLTPEQAEEILLLLDEALHYQILELILSALPLEVHDEFMRHFSENPASDELLTFVQQYSPEIEYDIRATAIEASKRFLDAIHA